MADVNRSLQVVISAQDEASNVIKGIGGSFMDLADKAKLGSAAILGGFTLIAKGAIDTASEFQQARVAFETFLGSGEKAGQLLSQISDFAAKTPFNLPQVVDGTRRLLAYGVAAEDIIPTFKTLGDISSGNKQRLDQLVLAYGQVKAATRLTGAELRQFTEAGVPLLDALANEFNKNGGKMVAMGGAAKKTKVDVGELNDKLAIAKQRLSEASANAKTKQSTLMSLKNTVQNYEQKISSANDATGKFSGTMAQTKVTAGDVKKMIESGAVSFEDVQKALSKLNSEGGMFFKNMENQSKTFGGVMSNVQDEITRFALSTMGLFVSGPQAGTVREGSIFYYLQKGAEALLYTLQTARPIVQQFVDTILGNMPAVAAIIGALAGLMVPLVIAFIGLIAPALLFAAAGAAIGAALVLVIQGLQQGNPLIWGLTAALTALGIYILATLIPTWVALVGSVISGAFSMIVALLPILWPFILIGAAVALLAVAWNNNWGDIQGKTKLVVDWLTGTAWPRIKTFGDQLQALAQLIGQGWSDWMNKIRGAIDGVKNAIGDLIRKGEELASRVAGGLKIPGFQHGGFVPGALNEAVPAILHGGERVVPRNGVDVNSAPVAGMNLSINFSGPVNMDSSGRVDELAKKIIDILGRQNELAAKGLAV